MPFIPDDEHYPNDGWDVPILCYGCGEQWPCPTIKARVPDLDLEGFLKYIDDFTPARDPDPETR